MRFQPKMFAAVLVAGCIPLFTQTTETGPSFSCAHVTSRVNRLICASTELSALDREVALVFGNMRGQPLDQAQLRLSEDAWLRHMQRDCSDAACIKARYQARLAELKTESLRVASPAAYEETRPFPAPSALMARAQALVGQPCTYKPDIVGPVIPGFTPAAGFLAVIFSGLSAVIREEGTTRLAFLISSTPGTSSCEILDVAALPDSAVAGGFLQCSASDPALAGFGVRDLKTHKLEAFWSVNTDSHKIERVPVGVLGLEKDVKCRQPETGE